MLDKEVFSQLEVGNICTTADNSVRSSDWPSLRTRVALLAKTDTYDFPLSYCFREDERTPP
jgi:hypothetical protein